MVSALDSGLSSPGTLCRVLRQDTLISQCLSPGGCIDGYWQMMLGGNLAMD